MGCPLTRWQNYFSVTAVLSENMCVMRLKKENWLKIQCGQNLPTLLLMEKIIMSIIIILMSLFPWVTV